MTLTLAISKSIHADIFYDCRKIVMAKLKRKVKEWRGCVRGTTLRTIDHHALRSEVSALSVVVSDLVVKMSEKSTLQVAPNRHFYTNSIFKSELLQMNQTNSLTPCTVHHLHVRSRRLRKPLLDRQGKLRWQQHRPLALSVLTAHAQPVCRAVAATKPRSYR